MKQIKVDCCGNCPLRYESFLMGYGKINRCGHQAIEGMELNDLSIVNPDCPLEDAKED